jgi:biotin operon repressor/DNA-binding XRE family transcriptional regulator
METNKASQVSQLVREGRQRKYKTAKDYWQENQETLRVSYPHYSSIEAGTKFPDIQLAVAIAKTLKLDLRLICHVWAKDQMPDAETSAYFDPVPGTENKGIPTAMHPCLDEFYVFTEQQIPALLANSSIWEILVFVMAFTDSTPPTELQIGQALGVERKSVTEAIEWLRNEGLLFSDKGVLRARRKYFHLPNTPPFRKIRDNNFVRISKDLAAKITSEQLAAKTAYRTTFMRRLTEVQAIEISQHIDGLVGHLGNMDNHGQEFYALTVGFGPRTHFNPRKS